MFQVSVNALVFISATGLVVLQAAKQTKQRMRQIKLSFSSTRIKSYKLKGFFQMEIIN